MFKVCLLIGPQKSMWRVQCILQITWSSIQGDTFRHLCQNSMLSEIDVFSHYFTVSYLVFIRLWRLFVRCTIPPVSRQVLGKQRDFYIANKVQQESTRTQIKSLWRCTTISWPHPCSTALELILHAYILTVHLSKQTKGGVQCRGTIMCWNLDIF